MATGYICQSSMQPHQTTCLVAAAATPPAGGANPRSHDASSSSSPPAEQSRALLELIKSCGKQKNLYKARRIHAQVLQTQLLDPHDASSSSIPFSLLQMYSECGAVTEAQRVFDQLLLPTKNRDAAAAWSLLIKMYAQHGHGEIALQCFKKMLSENLRPDAATFASALKACRITRSLNVAEEIHVEVHKRGLLKKNIVLGTLLMDIYAKCGVLGKAREVFEELPVRDVVSWSVLITGYAQCGLSDEALKCFQTMQDEGISPDAITFACILKACSSIGYIHIGEEIHCEIRKQGLLKKNTILSTTLADMYMKCGMLGKAQEVFDELLIRDVVSWCAMMAGYSEHNRAEEALVCFQRMQNEGILPDAFSFACILQACSRIGYIDIGKRIHAEVRMAGLLKKNSVLGTTLVDMYAKCGCLGKAQEAFDELLTRDVVSWSALMNAYIQHGFAEEALNCFRKMRKEGITPNVITLTSALKACGNIGSLEVGEEIHNKIREQSLLETEVMLGITLMDMYAKCGVLTKAQRVFEKIPVQDVVSWNALLAGHTQLGHATHVLMLFSEMVSEGIMPDLVTFVSLLAACSHAGLLEEGTKVFACMSSVYNILPTLEHYTCLVDLFSRAGHLDKSAILCESLSSSERLPLLLSVLSACQKWMNVELGRWAFEQCLQLDRTCAAAYVFMGNIYIAANMHGEADWINSLRGSNEEII